MEVTKHILPDGIEWRIYWPSTPIPKRVYVEVRKHLLDHADYSAINGAKLAMLKALRQRIHKKHSVLLSMEQLVSIHDVVIKGKIISRYHLIAKQIPVVSRRYDNGESIIDLSKRYDLPPLNLLHSILLHKYGDGSKTVLYDLFKTTGQSPDLSVLSKRDAVQFKMAMLNDAETGFNHAMIQQAAEAREREFVRRFRALGIKIKTQDQLVVEQNAEFGRAVITPDILILDKVLINGVQVHWIDYKNYAGTTVPFIARSNKKQAARYYDKWGVGAVAYQYSYVDDLIVPNTLLLDASVLAPV